MKHASLHPFSAGRGGAGGGRRAGQVVAEHEAHLAQLVSVHRRCHTDVDWHDRASMPPPPAPEPLHTREDAAIAAWNAYEPTRWERLLGRARRRREALFAAIEPARQQDAAENERRAEAHRQELAAWEQHRALAARVLARDPAAYAVVLDAEHPLRELRVLGSQITWDVVAPERIGVTLHTYSQQVIPAHVKSLGYTGEVVTKPMPRDRFLLLYQDYVCSAVLRVAREVFVLLPVDEVGVTAVDDVLNTATGHFDPYPILSVLFTREGLAGLNLDRIDPSDAMQNFTCRMDFDPGQGFRPIDPLAFQEP